MSPSATSVFALPGRLAAKAAPALVADDEAHFARLAATLAETVSALTDRLESERRAPGGRGQAALERDLEVHRLSGRLRTLRRFGPDLCLGRVTPADGSGPVHVGRVGLTDGTGRRLLVDWRSPAAEPFFAATPAHPMGLAARRRYRWTDGRISDYWDEVFGPDGAPSVALDEDSALLATLGASRSARMRDVLSTIQADQDAIVRAPSRGALVVDGGPGTGKTVVALHRAAYLLYADPRLGHQGGSLLVVGPHQPYLAYVSDVLPSLGEEGVRTCTVRDLVPEGAAAVPEPDPAVARLKATVAMVEAIEPAVGLYEEPPTEPLLVETPWADLRLDVADWREAFGAPDPGTPHNQARDQVWEALLAILVDRYAAEGGAGSDDDEEPYDPLDPYADPFGGDDEEADLEQVRRALAGHRALAAAFDRAWPLVEATDLVGDLWTVPAYLRRCAPWLAPDEVSLLQRADPEAWTVSDLPLLDAARRRLGDPEDSRRRRRREAALRSERAAMDDVVDALIAAGGDDDLGLTSSLRQEGLRSALVDADAAPAEEHDALADGTFAHVVVDEAQELTDAEWRMLLARCPSRSLTVVGDRAQARQGFAESWAERLERVGITHVEHTVLGVNYRTPAEVMAAAEPVIRAVLPDANVPTSIRTSGRPVRHGHRDERDAVLADWLANHDDGVACVIGDPSYAGGERVRSLTPELAKGLEFDLVVLLTPEDWGAGVAGSVDRYVAMTRATQQLVVLSR